MCECADYVVDGQRERTPPVYNINNTWYVTTAVLVRTCECADYVVEYQRNNALKMDNVLAGFPEENEAFLGDSS